MTQREALFLAKKLYVELVYNTAYIEGVNVTFAQTQTILDGGVVNNLAVDDIQTVLNLRDGWKHVLNTVEQPITLDYHLQGQRGGVPQRKPGLGNAAHRAGGNQRNRLPARRTGKRPG